ncbi:MAG: cation-binding protein, partial [Elusimicrobia bacterium]|nr:cation-binding protein [Elusimicrobiota bacterium]MBD3411667.1 cation-binding protein [Elusimicrobiota bacterium]
GAAIDFLRTYADACHHGKEEDILFVRLSGKNIAENHARTMQQLKDDHVYGRKTVSALNNTRKNYMNGIQDALNEMCSLMQDLIELYPRHIHTEDHEFFLPCMKYFKRKELDAMLKEFDDFDRRMVHDRYKKVVEHWEKERGL